MHIEIENVGDIGILWMENEPENRFNQEFLDNFNKALDEIESNPGIKAMIFSSRNEKYFCNGIDILWAMSQDYDNALKFLLTYVGLVHRLFLFPKPVIAAINGHAFAGGFFLALCADWRIMREDYGWMCIPEIDLPFDLPPGHIALTAYVIGSRNTDYFALSGERINAREALRTGVIDEVASKNELLPKAIEMAKQLGRKNPEQYRRHKNHLRAGPAKILAEEDPEFMKDLVEKVKGGEK